jgi:hypothetical protein
MVRKTGYLSWLFLSLVILAMALAGCQASSPGAVTDPTGDADEAGAPSLTVSSDEALELAGQWFPDAYSGQFTVTAQSLEGVWQVRASLYRNILSGNELSGWPEQAVFLNYGLLPEGQYRLLMAEIDGGSGELLSLTASDSLAMPEDISATPAINPACGGCEDSA